LYPERSARFCWLPRQEPQTPTLSQYGGKSPDIDTEKPVSRQKELELLSGVHDEVANGPPLVVEEHLFHKPDEAVVGVDRDVAQLSYTSDHNCLIITVSLREAPPLPSAPVAAVRRERSPAARLVLRHPRWGSLHAGKRPGGANSSANAGGPAGAQP
jgi:hypothetical protein